MEIPEMRKIIWAGLKSPAEYEKAIKATSPGLGDEIFVKNYIEEIKKFVIIVSLGIGTGRELSWLEEIKNISQIIGIDYAESMLNFCRKIRKKFRKKLILIREDMLYPKKLEKKVKKFKKIIIYLCLENTFGNFIKKERKIFLKKLEI